MSVLSLQLVCAPKWTKQSWKMTSSSASQDYVQRPFRKNPTVIKNDTITDCLITPHKESAGSCSLSLNLTFTNQTAHTRQ